MSFIIIISVVISLIAGIITIYWFFFLRPKELGQREERMIAIPSPIQDGAYEFVPKDEIEVGKILKEADSLFHQGKFKEAEEEYKKAYDIAKKFKKGKLIGLSLLSIGAAKGMKGDLKGAMKDLKNALKYKKELEKEAIAVIYFNLGYLEYSFNNLKGAIKNYDEAIKLNPNLAEAYNNRGNAYYNKGEFEKAIEDYTKAINLNPNYAIAYYNRGNAIIIKKNMTRQLKIIPKLSI